MGLTAFAVHHESAPTRLHLVGVNGAAFACIATAALNSGTFSSLTVETQGFRFGSITAIRDVNLLPGAVKYGDLPAYLALCTPTPLTILGETPDSAPMVALAGNTEDSPIEWLASDAAADSISQSLITKFG